MIKNLFSNFIFLAKELVNTLNINKKMKGYLIFSSTILMFTLLVMNANVKADDVIIYEPHEKEEKVYTEEDILKEIETSNEYENEGWNFGKEENSVNQDTQNSVSQSSQNEHQVSTEIYKTLNESHKVNFMDKILNEAIQIAEEYKVHSSVMIAQSILESDWGRSPLAIKANNIFGVKGEYKGNSVDHQTKEDDGNGNMYEIVDQFAKYPSFKESMESNAKLLRNGPSFDSHYYSGTWKENSDNYKQATSSLTGTYATDTSYEQKLNTIIEKHKLYVLD